MVRADRVGEQSSLLAVLPVSRVGDCCWHLTVRSSKSLLLLFIVKRFLLKIVFAGL